MDSADETLGPDSHERIDDELQHYEEELRNKFRRASDDELIRRRTSQFRAQLLRREEADEERDLEDIRREERFNISSNMVLSMILMVLFTSWAVVRAEDLVTIAGAISTFVSTNLSWYINLLSSGFLIFLLYLAFSRFGNVVLGDPGEEPEFSDLSWYAMLFSAGMGVGLLFWGGAEPLYHFLFPPIGVAGSAESARRAFVLTSFHWGMHGWGIYTTCAIGVAYYGFRKRKKYLISSSVMDVFSNPAINRVLKIFADLVATLAILFGVAASLGLGTLQICSGLQHVYGIPANSATGIFVVLGLITACFVASATTGLDKGIKILSNLNMILAILLLIFVFLAGPKVFILKIFVDSIGQYLANIVPLSFNVAPFNPEYQEWMASWTLTYLTWWMAWAPFVGVFIARISRGRTIKEVVLGSLIAPTLLSLAWFAVFGGAAIHLEMFTDHGIGELIQGDKTVALFALLGNYPLYELVSALAIFLLFTFLVTSADSATFVISMMTTEGDLDPRLGTKVMWGAVLALVTGLLILDRSLEPVQAAALASALPFSLVLILITVSVSIRLSLQVGKTRI